MIIGAGLFVGLTVAAMFLYPGGSFNDTGTTGYSFFNNFFSELGFLRTKSGAVNTPSAVLFIASLTMAGGGLVFFFLAFPQFFVEMKDSKRIMSLVGSVAGVLSGLCFIGVAWSPADVLLDFHVFFVLWAFRLFPLAAACYAAVIFLDKQYPHAYGWVFVVFSLLLISYICLLELGPSPKDSVSGQVIQVTGQKVIVYASIVSVMVQAVGSLRQNKNER